MSGVRDPRSGKVRLGAPTGVVAELHPSPRIDPITGQPVFLSTLVSEISKTDQRDVRIRMDGPGAFGHHSKLLAVASGKPLPLDLHVVRIDESMVGAICAPDVPLGIDVRRRVPSTDEMRDMRRHSHLFPGTRDDELRTHWTRVQAVRAADGRGARVAPERVLIDPPSSTGWVFDRRDHYQLVDLSTDDWVITLAHGALRAITPSEI